MKYGQIVTNSGVKGVDVSGTKEIFGVTIMRHAGDHADGMEDSWCIYAEIKLSFIDSDEFIYTSASLNALNMHGLSMDKIRNLSARILLQGDIDASLWNFVNVK